MGAAGSVNRAGRAPGRRVTCHTCGQHLQVPDSISPNHSVGCPRCGNIVVHGQQQQHQHHHNQPNQPGQRGNKEQPAIATTGCRMPSLSASFDAHLGAPRWVSLRSYSRNLGRACSCCASVSARTQQQRTTLVRCPRCSPFASSSGAPQFRCPAAFFGAARQWTGKRIQEIN